MDGIDRRTFMIAGGSALLAACSSGGGTTPSPQPTDTGDDGFGGVMSPQEYAAWDAAPQHAGMAALAAVAPALYGRALGTPPSAVTLSNLPAVTTQGTATSPGFPGSCEAQSFGTGLGTYTAARNPDGSKKWDAQPLYNQVSAAWLFAKAIAEGAAKCKGGSALAHVDNLVAVGAPNANSIPYKPDCNYFTSIDVNPADYKDPGKLRIGSYRVYKISGDPSLLQKQIDEFTAMIAAGHVIAFSGLVALLYGKNTAQFMKNGVFTPTPPKYSSTSKWQAPYNDFCAPPCGHGQIVVGYDNDKQAFLVQNSMGTSWPPNVGGGQLWWAYSSFFGSQGLAAIAYPQPSGTPAGTPFVVTPNPSAFPIGTVAGAAASTKPVNGKYVLTAVIEFGNVVHITQSSVTPPGGLPLVQADNFSISRGYVDFHSDSPWPSGTYTIALSITYNGAQATYTASVNV